MRYWVILILMVILGLAFAYIYVNVGNMAEPGTQPWKIIAARRSKTLITMLIVAVCQAMATLAFQTVTTNRILTPSIMGFESLYAVIQTGTIFVGGVAGFVAFQGTGAFLLQVGLMVALAVFLYGWLLSGKFGNLHVMLLVGIIIGTGMRSLSTFMQRMLSPSEFDVLSARMFGSLANAKTDEPVAIILTVFTSALLFFYSRRLNTVALGRDVAVNGAGGTDDVLRLPGGDTDLPSRGNLRSPLHLPNGGCDWLCHPQRRLRCYAKYLLRGRGCVGDY